LKVAAALVQQLSRVITMLVAYLMILNSNFVSRYANFSKMKFAQLEEN